MPRLRTKGKTSGPPVVPEVIARTRSMNGIRHSPRASVPRPSIEVHISAAPKTTSSQSAVQTRSHDKSTSNQGRVTRSNKGNVPLTKSPPPTRKKRHAVVAEAEEKPTKRQRRLSYKTKLSPAKEEEEEEPAPTDQENEENEEDEEAAEESVFPKQDFFDGINSSLGVNASHSELPKLRPNGSAKTPAENNTRAVIEVGSPAVVDAVEENETSSAAVENPEKNQASSRRPKKPEAAQEQPRAAEQEMLETEHEQPSQPILKNVEKKTPVSSARGRRESKQGKQRISQPDRQSTPVPPEHQEEGQQENEKGGKGKEDNGKEEEENDQAYNSSDNEPAAEREVDISDLAEDSLVLDAPPEDSETSGPVPTACIKRESVQKLMYVMTLRGWMDKRHWPQEILELARVQAQALAEQPNCLVLSRIIVAKLSDLYELCENIPSTRRSEQLAYLRDNTIRLSGLISTLRHAIDRFISRINTIMDQGDGEQVKVGYKCVTKAHRRILPMLVLVLDTVFQAGCREPRGSSKKAATHKGDFTVYLLEPLERAAGWAQRLSQVVENWYELHPPRRERDKEDKAEEHRRRFSGATRQLKKVLEKAREAIDAIKSAPEIRRKAMQRDEALRREREEDAQRHRDAQDLQMQRFLQSVQNINSSQPQSRISSFRQTMSSARRSASHSGLVASQEAPEDAYFEKHGWHYWEDDQLLSLIRTTSHPNYNVFRQMLPDRNPDELRERSRYLRMVMRDKYQRKGIPPPGWCLDED